uniref:Secreted protein n=1 Tax=Aegilops tauschii subsp. strangulata TaxID=200361 RepID=A0A453R9W2_AEGTS
MMHNFLKFVLAIEVGLAGTVSISLERSSCNHLPGIFGAFEIISCRPKQRLYRAYDSQQGLAISTNAAGFAMATQCLVQCYSL